MFSGELLFLPGCCRRRVANQRIIEIPATHYLIFPSLVSPQQLPLRQSSPVLAKWSKVTVPIHFKVYIFDVMNSEDFIDGRTPPALRQRGPYTFFETREKVVDSFSNDSILIEYDDIKKFYFEPQLSVGSLDDEVNVINVPLVVSRPVSSRWPEQV